MTTLRENDVSRQVPARPRSALLRALAGLSPLGEIAVNALESLPLLMMNFLAIAVALKGAGQAINVWRLALYGPSL